jgi:outer membrane protein
MRQFILSFLFIFLIPSYALAVEYSLDDLYRIGLERSERIKISEEDLFIAERGKDKAVSLLLPKLSAYGNYTEYTEAKYSSTGSVVQPETSKYWGLRLDQSFTISGRELTAFKISKDNIRKSRYDLYFIKEDYLFLVSSSYYDVLRAKKALEIAKANVQRLTKHRDAAAVRLKVGEVTKTVLLRAEAELSGAQSEEIRARNGLELAKAVLVRVVGIEKPYDVKESIVGSQESFKTQELTTDSRLSTLDDLKQLAFSERSDIKSFELQKNIAENQVTYTQGAFWPIFSIEGVYHRKDDDPASAFFVEESIYGGLKLTFPFFEGGLRIAEVRESKAKMRQAVLAYDDRKKAINVEVEDAYLNLITQKGVMEKFEAQVAFAEDNYKAVSKQFEHGIANSIDVMDANTLLVTAERQLADARYNYQLAILKLKRATGMLLKTVVSQQSSVVSQDLKER